MFTTQIQQNQQRLWELKLLSYLFWTIIFAPILIELFLIPIGIDYITNNPLTFATKPFFSILSVIFIITSIIVSLKQNQQLTIYQNLVPTFINQYHAKLIRNHDKYQTLIDMIDEICIGLNFETPEIYLIDTSTIDNLTTLRQNDTNYLFLTTHLIETLSRYELTSIIAISLIDTQTKYQKLNVLRYLTYQPMRNLFKNQETFLSLIWLLLFNFRLNILIMLELEIKYRYKQTVKQHLKTLSQASLKLTSNPETLINALTKINQSNENFTPKQDFTDMLWINPLNLKATSLHESLKTQIKILQNNH